MLTLYDPWDLREIRTLLEEALMNQCEFYASELRRVLEYDDHERFEDAVASAVRACATLRIPIRHHIRTIFRCTEKEIQRDYIISRFACHLIIMNADPGYPAVAEAQLYFTLKR
jgi:DNA-damage-inducible protein D